MRAVSELLGRMLLWGLMLWLGIIMILPQDVRPLVACGPVVWVTRSLGDFIASAAGNERAAGGNAEAVGSFARGCMRVMTRYLDAGAIGS